MAASQHESQEEAASDKSQNSEGPISARRQLAAGMEGSANDMAVVFILAHTLSVGVKCWLVSGPMTFHVSL